MAKKAVVLQDVINGLDADLYLLDLAITHKDPVPALRLRVKLMRDAIARVEIREINSAKINKGKRK